MARISRTGASPSAIFSAAEQPEILERQPLGTVSMLLHKVPIQQVPRAWRATPLDLNLDVELRPERDGTVAIYAPMRAGMAARFLGPKVRKMGILPDLDAATVLLKLNEGARLRARLIDAPPPQLRARETDMGFFLSIRCKA